MNASTPDPRPKCPKCPKCGSPARNVIVTRAHVRCTLNADGSRGKVLSSARGPNEVIAYECGGGHTFEAVPHATDIVDGTFTVTFKGHTAVATEVTPNRWTVALDGSDIGYVVRECDNWTTHFEAHDEKHSNPEAGPDIREAVCDLMLGHLVW